MLYSRNKAGFKKQSTRVQHKEAHKRILSTVRDFIDRDGAYHANNQYTQNKCTNSQKPETDYKPVVSNFSKESKQPLLCQSILEQPQRKRKVNSKSFTVEHVIDYSIKSIDNSSKAARAQRQYMSLLQSKVQQLEKELQAERQQKRMQKQYDQIRKHDLEYQKLIRFYHRARNIIVLQSVELLECKNALGQAKSNQSRVKSINSSMAKSEELLQVYRRGIQNGSPRKQSSQLAKTMQISELKDLCEYQEKTIQFLRKQTQPSNQFNQIKLLRHEINRVCTQNQILLQKLSKLSKIQQKQPQNILIPPQNKQEHKKLLSELAQKQNNIQKLQIQVDELRMNLLQQSNKLFTMQEQKKCAMQMAQSATERNQQLQHNIVELEIIIDKHEAQLHELKTTSVKAANKIVIQNYDIATTEELLKQLKPYPRYEKLLFSIINQYETKISELRTQVCSERELKEKYKQWASEVYHLMESAQIPPQILQKHMNQLYAFNDKMDCSKIEKFLRQIRAFSIGIDEKDVREMEAELEEYIVSLKSRNQVIKEADCEDGSSVAVSDTFTDQEFDEQ